MSRNGGSRCFIGRLIFVSEPLGVVVIVVVVVVVVVSALGDGGAVGLVVLGDILLGAFVAPAMMGPLVVVQVPLGIPGRLGPGFFVWCRTH